MKIKAEQSTDHTPHKIHRKFSHKTCFPHLFLLRCRWCYFPENMDKYEQNKNKIFHTNTMYRRSTSTLYLFHIFAMGQGGRDCVDCCCQYFHTRLTKTLNMQIEDIPHSIITIMNSTGYPFIVNISNLIQKVYVCVCVWPFFFLMITL